MEDKTNKYKAELIKNANLICGPGKGILAADQNTPTIQKYFDHDNLKIENSEENRRKYRELLFTAPKIEEYISAVIMYEETYYQNGSDGKPLRDLLISRGIIPGVKGDIGMVTIGPLAESATQGLDDLAKRCAKYYAEGARFAKWRAILRIGDGCPSDLAIQENAHGLARYACICQENGLVPIIEPDILIDGNHDIDVCAKVSEKVFSAVIKTCQDYGVLFEGALLKPNMVTPGKSSTVKASSQEIAFKTVRTLSRTVPSAFPGVMFLSGGQTEQEATENLNEMNKLTEFKKAWNLSFSYGRALQQSVLKAWNGKDENKEKAQEVLLQLAKNNSAASLGKYSK